MTFNGSLQDRIAIRELIDTYNSAVIRRDSDAWRNTWTDDATWVLLGTEVNGLDHIFGAWEAAMAGFEFVSFMACPGTLEIDQDNGSGTVHVAETLVTLDKQQRNIFGLYADDYHKNSDGEWQFSRRDYSILYEY